MVIKIVATTKTQFRVRIENGNGDRKHLAFVFATDPPNTVEHYNILSTAMLKRFEGATIVVFELPGFGLSSSSCSTLNDTADSIAELLQVLGKDHLNGKTIGLILPCVSGILSVEVLKKLPAGLVSFLAVPQCGDYACERNWADGVNINGMLSFSIVSRIINYIRRRSISKGWYNAAFPRRGHYRECVGPDLVDADVDTAAKHVRETFLMKTMKNFDEGGKFPLAYFLQACFFSPATADLAVLSTLRKESAELDQNNLIQVPTFGLWGMLDGSHKHTFENHEAMSSFGKYVKEGLFSIDAIESSAHFPELQFPETFAKKLEEFLQNHQLI